MISAATGVMRDATVPSRVLTKRTSRSVSRPFNLRSASTTTSVPARRRRISATASDSGVSGVDRIRIADDDVLHPLDLGDFAHLRLDVAVAEAAIDDADAAFFGLHDRHRRARDGVHVGRHQRPLERDVASRSGTTDRSPPDRGARSRCTAAAAGSRRTWRRGPAPPAHRSRMHAATLRYL